MRIHTAVIVLSNALEAIPDLSHTIFALADVSTSETSGLDYRREGVLCRGDGGISVVSKVGGLEAEGEDTGRGLVRG